MVCSGHGSSPMNASPITTRTNPAIFTCVCLSTVPPIAAAPAPSRTNTVVKPRINGMLATTIRRLTPRSPRRSTSTAEIAERYPGSGSTQGVITDTRPARNAIGSFSVIEPLERLVDPTLVLGPERVGYLRSPGSDRVLDHACAPTASAAAAAAAPPSGMTHARRSNPLVLEVERIVGPNSSTASRICRSVWQAAIRRLTSDFISRATSESDSSSVVWQRAHEQRLEAPLARMPRAGSCRGRERKRHRGHRGRDQPRDLSAEPDAVFEVARRGRAGDVRRHDAAPPVDEERLGDARDSPAPECRADPSRMFG